MIENRIEEFSITHDSYARSVLFQDMLTMPMIRICEIAKLYRTNLEALDPNYDWKSVGAMRDKMAHPYGGFDYDFVWDATQVDLPELMAACHGIVSASSA